MISQLRVAVVCTQNLVSPKNSPHKELLLTSQVVSDRIRLWIWSRVNLLGQSLYHIESCQRQNGVWRILRVFQKVLCTSINVWRTFCFRRKLSVFCLWGL